MSITTYGEHAENAAAALNHLVRTEEIPADPAAVEQLLHCREAVIDALRQRLFDLGQDTWYPPPDHLPARTPKPDLTGLDEKLASLVDNIAFALPSLPIDERLSPADYLGPPSADTTVESWRTAATELLSASHALAAAEEQPWRTEAGSAWWVMRDVAVALEAVLVLDARLDEVGLLSAHQRPRHVMGLEAQRMVLSQTARAAAWYATNDRPDEATPRVRMAIRTAVVHPVSMVSTPTDLAAAQRRLATFLRPTHAADAFFSGEPEITADSARQVTASQLYLCRVFADAADQSEKTKVFATFFEQRAEILESLQPQISHLADATHVHEPNMHRFWQQSELTTAVIRMEDCGTKISLQPTEMLALAEATHEVTYNLGKCLRLELVRSNGNLVDASPRHRDGPARVGRWSRLTTTVTDLVNLSAPREPVSRFTNPLQRTALQQTLDQSPTSGSRTPSPFPAARAAAYRGPGV